MGLLDGKPGLIVVHIRWLFLFFILFLPQIVEADNGDSKHVDDLFDMSLESLMQVEVTSVAKKPQQIEDTTAAIYVISREDILRSGVTTIPEALRLAPGVNIAHTSSNQWSISIRGFNGYLSNKLLVLLDGRTIYSPIFSGVFWNQQDVLLQDIDRIEVIRGPGGTLWGANAVNGVINIITLHSKESQGGLLEASGGNVEDPSAAIRYGGKINDDAHYRVYGKHADHGNFELANGRDAQDDWQHEQVGGRIDWDISARDALTLQGDAYYGEQDKLFKLPVVSLTDTVPGLVSGHQHGANVLARWSHKTRKGDEITLQTYYDRVGIKDETPVELIQTWDVDFQHHIDVTERIDALWGLGYRHVDYNSDQRLAISLPGNDLDLFSGFVQGDIALTEKFRLTLGSKFEHNDFTGFEWQPNLRLLWNLHENHSVWAAVSRAVRTPSPTETTASAFTLFIPGAPPILSSTLPNPDVESEELIAFEIGTHNLVRPDLFVDISAFYNIYDNLLGFASLPPVFETTPAPPHILAATTWSNEIQGESYGLETVIRWHPRDDWRLEGSYSLLRVALHATAANILDDGFLAGPSAVERGSPQQQFQVRSYYDLSDTLAFDVSLFWVDRLPAFNLDDYLRADIHLGWRPVPNLSLDLFAHNLLDDRHEEGDNELYVTTEVPRSVLVRAVWRW
jgi:iron complex outermembrane receptor protein